MVDKCRRYNKPNQCRITDTISGVHDSSGSAKTLVKRGEITNHHLIAYSFSKIAAKKLPKSVDVH